MKRCSCDYWRWNGRGWRDETGRGRRVETETTCVHCGCHLTRVEDPETATGYAPAGGATLDENLKRRRILLTKG